MGGIVGGAYDDDYDNGIYAPVSKPICSSYNKIINQNKRKYDC